MIHKNSICCVFNYGSHYRESIFQLMDKELACDFYLGDSLLEKIAPMDYDSLSGYKKLLKNKKFIGNYFWQTGAFSTLMQPYKHYIIDGEPYNISNWVILFFAKLFGKRVYTWTHGWYGRESSVKKCVKKIFFSMAYHNFLYGDYAKNLMIAEGFSSRKLSCIYNSLDYENQLKYRINAKTSSIYSEYFKNEYPNLIFSGRLTKSKRLDMLLIALVQLKNNNQYVNLTLIGPPDIENDLVLLTNKLDLKNEVWFYGECYDELKLSELIFNADLCVSPGNVGLTAIHSLMYGTPVLTHNHFPNQGPEFEAIIDGITGCFYKFNNQKSLEESISMWIFNDKDREQIRHNCYEIIDNHYNPYFQIQVLKDTIQI